MTLDLTGLPLLGVLAPTPTSAGLALNRVPAWARTQIDDRYFDLMASMPAGGRLAFRTDSAFLELELQLMTLHYAAGEPPHPFLDVVVDGAVAQSIELPDHRTLTLTATGEPFVIPGDPASVRIALPGDRDHAVEVWFPHNATVQVLEARIEDGTRLEPLPEPRRWVHYGSSISQCLEAPTPTQTWPAIVARSEGLALTNLGLGGQCQLDQQIARVVRDLAADVLSVKVGINLVGDDTMRERAFRPALHAFLDTVRDGHPATPVLLVTPVHCPAAEERPGPMSYDGRRFGVVGRPPELAAGALSLRRLREVIAAVAERRGDAHLHLVDGLTLLGPDDAHLLPDGLHPDAAGYRLIAERFVPWLRARLEQGR